MNKDVPVHEFTNNNIWMLGTLTQAGWDPPSLGPWQPPTPLCAALQTAQPWGVWPYSSPHHSLSTPYQSTHLPLLVTCWLSIFFNKKLNFITGLNPLGKSQFCIH